MKALTTALKNILIVDDSTTERAVVAAELKNAGHAVLTAEDGRGGCRAKPRPMGLGRGRLQLAKPETGVRPQTDRRRRKLRLPAAQV
jgi:hypothetical protein